MTIKWSCIFCGTSVFASRSFQFAEQLILCYFMQALFRKIAAALPGMEALSSHKDDLVDVNLKPASNPQAEGKAGGCAC